MSPPFFSLKKPDPTKLAQAIASNPRDDALARFMPEQSWPALCDYMTVEDIDRGRILVAQGALDRALYFVEAGSLRVHYGDKAGQIHVATLGPGSVVGEGAFLSQRERNATVQAVEPSRVWELTPERFRRMSKENAPLALELTLALGAVVSTRMLDISKRVAVT